MTHVAQDPLTLRPYARAAAVSSRFGRAAPGCARWCLGIGPNLPSDVVQGCEHGEPHRPASRCQEWRLSAPRSLAGPLAPRGVASVLCARLNAVCATATATYTPRSLGRRQREAGEGVGLTRRVLAKPSPPGDWPLGAPVEAQGP
jgi:hypothetical protein